MQEYRAQRPDAEVEITSFSSGILLLEHLRLKGSFDAYLLDVIMPGENGIQLGLGIRELDRGGRIIYLTSSRDFAVDAYRVNAWDYLLKPLSRERLFRTLDEVEARLARDRRALLCVKTRDGFRRLPFRSIMYGELKGRCIRYHLSDGSEMESTSLRSSFRDAVGPLLEDRGFVLCSASFFVNLLFVEKVGSSGLRLTGGLPLPLSRPFRAEVTNRWLDYYLKEEADP